VSPNELFVGRFDRALDSKGRVILPARLRATFENAGYLAPHEDGCIALWTDAEFGAEADRQHAREADGQGARHEVREWFSHVTRVQMDAQGRMPIPPDLRSHADLEQDVVIVGVHDRVELWSRPRWDDRIPATAGAGS
jgi:MraZ protein